MTGTLNEAAQWLTSRRSICLQIRKRIRFRILWSNLEYVCQSCLPSHRWLTILFCRQQEPSDRMNYCIGQSSREAMQWSALRDVFGSDVSARGFTRSQMASVAKAQTRWTRPAPAASEHKAFMLFLSASLPSNPICEPNKMPVRGTTHTQLAERQTQIESSTRPARWSFASCHCEHYSHLASL